jgi:hypothetical protein
MRINPSVLVLVALCMAGPAAAQQPTVRGALRDAVLPRADSIKANQQKQAGAMNAAQGGAQNAAQGAQGIQAPGQQAPTQTQPGQAQPQQPTPPPVPEEPLPPTAMPKTTGDPVLMFEREVFTYQGRSRRDPFKPLTGAEGPLFEDLKINVILYSPNPAESVVLLSDNTNKQYRVKRGDTVGNCCTVVDIGPARIVFSVVDFGIRRQEVLAVIRPTERS